jgi:hypothetical protein
MIMKTTIAARTAVPALALAALLSFAAAPAQAQLARTFVSNAIGNDANNCDRPTPCRTFQAAHDKTLPAGEITVLDPGSYGAVTITKAISIINDGVGEAGVLVSGSGTGVTISAQGVDAVSLRGLTIKGIGFGGGNGIVFENAKSLTIENCVVRTLTAATPNTPAGNGIAIFPSTSTSLTMVNTLVAQNQGAGIWFVTSSPALSVVLDHVALYDNGIGLSLEGTASAGGVQVSAVDTTAAGNAEDGFFVESFNGGTDSLVLTRSTSANNGGAGLKVNAGAGSKAILRVGQSTITGNGSSWSSNGTLQSYGDNYVIGNGDGDPPIPTVIAKK